MTSMVPCRGPGKSRARPEACVRWDFSPSTPRRRRSWERLCLTHLRHSRAPVLVIPAKLVPAKAGSGNPCGPEMRVEGKPVPHAPGTASWERGRPARTGVCEAPVNENAGETQAFPGRPRPPRTRPREACLATPPPRARLYVEACARWRREARTVSAGKEAAASTCYCVSGSCFDRQLDPICHLGMEIDSGLRSPDADHQGIS